MEEAFKNSRVLEKGMEDKSGQSSLEERIKETFSGYSFEIRWPYARPLNPDCEAIEVVLTTRHGKKYISNFTTTQYIEAISKKNKETGECASGIYYAMPGMVVLEKLTPENIMKTIDCMIDGLEIDLYFEELQEK